MSKKPLAADHSSSGKSLQRLPIERLLGLHSVRKLASDVYSPCGKLTKADQGRNS